jgi:Holliday junction resolvase RusA-like endonuclease
MKFVITGRPATKKNSSRVVHRGNFTRVLPSEAFIKYERDAVKQIKALRLPRVDGPVQVEFLYWLPDCCRRRRTYYKQPASLKMISGYCVTICHEFAG